MLDACLARHGERIVVGIDARDGRVAVRGWADVSDTDAISLARDLAERGVRTIVYTDIARDGMLQGPNVAAVERMVAATPDVAVIASGGVGQLDDVVELSRTGARGVIVGKALYTGAIDLGTAVADVGRYGCGSAPPYPPKFGGVGRGIPRGATRPGRAAQAGGALDDGPC